MRNWSRAALRASIVTLLSLPGAQAAHAQGTTWAENWVGSEWEVYARALADRGLLGGEPWSIRPFAPSVIRTWAANAPADQPWTARLPRIVDDAQTAFAWLRPSLTSSYNSDFAWGSNDGPVWQGRGANLWGTAGFIFRSGPLSIRLEPLVEAAQNQAFRLEPTPAGSSPYVDDLRPGSIDLPQRFGASALSIVDPGQSYIRLDVDGAAIGLSTEDMFWGPGIRQALLFDGNAAGFPHLFLGTTHVVHTPVGGFNAQVVYGRLGESDWAPPSVSDIRLGAGGILVWTPIPTIELGGARFFHRKWNGLPSGADLVSPFGSFFGNNQTASSPDNQLLTVFAAIRVPSSGFEVFGEFGKNDRNSSLRDLAMEPEHNSAWMLGTFGVIGPPSIAGGFWTVRVEAGNGRVSAIQDLGRGQSTFYDHTFLTQGHTEDGQLLGSPLIDRSGGVDASLDRWMRRGRIGIAVLERQMPPDLGVGLPANQLRSQWDTGASATLFKGPFDVSLALGRVWDLDRFPGMDVANNYARVSLRAGWW